MPMIALSISVWSFLAGWASSIVFGGVLFWLLVTGADEEDDL